MKLAGNQFVTATCPLEIEGVPWAWATSAQTLIPYIIPENIDPKISRDLKKKILEEIISIDNQIDDQVYKFYGLTESERKIIKPETV